MKPLLCPHCVKGVPIDQKQTAAERRKARRKSKLGQALVASQMRISVSELSRMERGNRPWTPESIEQHIKICG